MHKEWYKNTQDNVPLITIHQFLFPLLQSAPDDIATISSTCFKLNSLQLRALLEKYQPTPDEPKIPQDLIDSVVAVSNVLDAVEEEEEESVEIFYTLSLNFAMILI